MTEINLIAEAIIRRFEQDSTTNKAFNNRMYFQQSPQDVISPYVVFYIIGITQEEIMGDADDNVTDITIQFNIFTDTSDGGQHLALLMKRITNCYDWNDVFVKGYNCLRMQREAIGPVLYIDEIWQNNIDYTLGIQKE